jgi:hypothetical protein
LIVFWVKDSKYRFREEGQDGRLLTSL